MRVEDVMTRDVLTVDVHTSLKEVAALLALPAPPWRSVDPGSSVGERPDGGTR